MFPQRHELWIRFSTVFGRSIPTELKSKLLDQITTQPLWYFKWEKYIFVRVNFIRTQDENGTVYFLWTLFWTTTVHSIDWIATPFLSLNYFRSLNNPCLVVLIELYIPSSNVSETSFNCSVISLHYDPTNVRLTSFETSIVSHGSSRISWRPF